MAAAAAQLEPLLRGGRTGLVRLAPAGGCVGRADVVEESGGIQPEPVTLLVESRLPPPRMLVFGANDFGAALVPAAKLLGYSVTLIDARPAFAGQARFETADEVVTDWPHRYLAAEAAAGRIDARTAICVLTHDPKFDIPLLEAALGLDVAFVGAMGSRRSHRQRIDALLAAGVPPEGLARLHSPIGLDLGAVTPAEVAVSITAELIAARNAAAACAPLRDGSGPIHHANEESRRPMDMNTIEAVVRTTDPAEWRDGDAWLAGGTVLFSYGSYAFGPEPLRRLLDLGSAGWPAVTVTGGRDRAGRNMHRRRALCAAGVAGTGEPRPGTDWPGLDLVRPCCDSFVASFKVWNMSTVGGNLCTSLPAGPMISLCAGLDGTATILGPGGASRDAPGGRLRHRATGRTALAPGELLRSIRLPASALSSRVAFRRLSLSNLGRSGVLLIGRLDGGGQPGR